MEFCKICDCGEKIIARNRMSFPDACPACSRWLGQFETFRADDPRVEDRIRERKELAAEKKDRERLPEASSREPGNSYDKPGRQYSEPGNSYDEPGRQYSEPGNSYDESGRQYSEPEDHSADGSSLRAADGESYGYPQNPYAESETGRYRSGGNGGSGKSVPQGAQYFLRLENGAEIAIPPEGGIVGRTELGGEKLAEYASVSRQHIRVIPRRKIGVQMEDLSTYGTMVDGRKLDKNMPVLVKVGSEITLCNVHAVLAEYPVS